MHFLSRRAGISRYREAYQQHDSRKYDLVINHCIYHDNNPLNYVSILAESCATRTGAGGCES